MRNAKSKALKNEYIEMYDSIKTELCRSNINNFIYRDLCVDLANYLYEFQINDKKLPLRDTIVEKFNRSNVKRSFIESLLMFLAWFSLIYIVLFIFMILSTEDYSVLTISSKILIDIIALGLVFNSNLFISNFVSFKSLIYFLTILVSSFVLHIFIPNIYFNLPITIAIGLLIIAILEIIIAYKFSKNNYFKYLENKQSVI